jgi:hypothetical protein
MTASDASDASKFLLGRRDVAERREIESPCEVKTAVPDISPSEASDPPSCQRHYTVAQVAEMWNLSEDAVRRLFCNEPGVLALGDSSVGRRKRRYVTLRIPQSVIDRVHRILSL